MKIYQIIPYWTDMAKGTNYVNSDNYYLKVGNSCEEVLQWAKTNSKRLNFKINNSANDIIQSSDALQFNIAVQEAELVVLHDVSDVEYRASIKLLSKIEVQRIEVPIDK